MTLVVVLDAGPLGLVAAPPRRPESRSCLNWLLDLLNGQCRVVIPEIVDYELRRELIRAGKTASVQRLDALVLAVEYLPLSTAILRLAAFMWAQARNHGRPTAADNTLDVDIILAAQALELGTPNLVIATTNVSHLGRFVPAKQWQEIAP